ncbi:RagB/SusD family nutrient uptake outer membrane protein [Chitinophaga sp. YIM B06452]|uniref:RagB/SusD family nutrient uptake outer membrane protein n=1 Tax=Chitinophaga sp. YIM B06452 TaxID=3082158 RepID=UPI0031FF2D5F
MTLKNFYITLLAIATIAPSCRKFVEVDQPNQRLFRYTADFQRLLSDKSVFERTASLPMLSADDINLDANASLQNLFNSGTDSIYIWGASYYTTDQSDATWDQLYNTVYVCNQVIENVLGSEGGTDAQKNSTQAEAKVQRAYTYLTLVNLYARPYNAATASTDPGLPLLLKPDLFVNLERASVQAVYDQVIKDLTEALPALPAQPSNNIHAAKAAAHATLARTYLYMQRFAEAAEQAGLALDYRNTVLDLNVYATGTAFPRRLDNPEVILARQVTMPGNFNLPLSDELLGKFQTNDLRYELYMRPGNTFQPAFTGRGSWRARLFGGDNVTTGITVPEVMLTQAEGLARTGQSGPAMNLVNALRQKRFRPADYMELTATDANAALRIVLDERRRELFGTGLRWYDQRRLSLEPALAETETRVFKGNTYTLVPGNRYVYPIPPKNIDLNPELTQNQR